MSIASMTGFARAAGQHGSEDANETGGLAWVWEVKSVNAKNLEIRTRLPAGFEGLEIDVRRSTQKALERGSVMASFQYKRMGSGAALAVNRPALDSLLSVAGEYAGRDGLGQASVGELLAVPGVVNSADNLLDEQEEKARRAAILGTLEEALTQLVAMRRAEGEALLGPLRGLLDEVERLTAAAESAQATQPEALIARFQTKLDEFLSDSSGISDERLAQEVALLAAKADVREELDRLASHVAAARDLLADDKPVGRKLDFLAQEFNREVNTICSKSADMELTRIGLDLKAVVGQFREQIQNIE